MKNKNGFTLLELLVVVLIIGILAAIALPQYQLAVDKTEFAKLQSVAVSLRAAYNEYILMHGTGTRNFDNLSVTLPDNFESSYTSWAFNCVSNESMFCCLSNYGAQQSAAIMCGKNDLSFVYSEIFIGISGAEADRRGYCKADKNNTRAKRLCGSIGSFVREENFWTPQGLKGGYNSYRLN